MINISHRVPVNTTRAKLWETLTERVEEPAKYEEGVESVEFKPWRGGMILRNYKKGVDSIQEAIQIDESRGLTRFELRDHPKYTGFTEFMVVEQEGQLYLAYEAQWESVNEAEDFEAAQSRAEKSIAAVKEVAEKG